VPNTGAPLALGPQNQPSGVTTPAPRAAAPAQPVRTAALPPAAPAGSYLVQVSAQRSEAEAQTSFRSLQGKYPTVLGNREPIIRRADLGTKGIYYRAQVGPFGTAEQAQEFCSSLKAAGGQCIVQRN
jgi:cell division septation protein DedD